MIMIIDTHYIREIARRAGITKIPYKKIVRYYINTYNLTAVYGFVSSGLDTRMQLFFKSHKITPVCVESPYMCEDYLVALDRLQLPNDCSCMFVIPQANYEQLRQVTFKFTANLEAERFLDTLKAIGWTL